MLKCLWFIPNLFKIKNPRLALLNIGSESNKGTDLIKASFDLMNEDLKILLQY